MNRNELPEHLKHLTKEQLEALAYLFRGGL